MDTFSLSAMLYRPWLLFDFVLLSLSQDQKLPKRKMVRVLIQNSCRNSVDKGQTILEEEANKRNDCHDEKMRDREEQLTLLLGRVLNST